MKTTIRNYFEYEKKNLSPSESDFQAVLNQIDMRQKSETIFVPAKTHFIQRVTFAFSVFAVLVLFINIKEAPQKLAEKQSITEAVTTIEEVDSFNE